MISVSWTDAIFVLTCASGLVKAVNTAVDLIVAHFGTSRDPGVKVFSTIRVYIALTEFCLYETLTLLNTGDIVLFDDSVNLNLIICQAICDLQYVLCDTCQLKGNS